MAAALLHIKPVFKTIVEDFFNKSLGIIRQKSRGPGKSDHGRPSRFGIKKEHNSIVKKSTVLYHQIRLEHSPGLNVGIGSVAKLYAKVPGRVVVSCEKTNYKPDDIVVRQTFPDYPPAYRIYMNVIPEPLHTRFKLVEKF